MQTPCTLSIPGPNRFWLEADARPGSAPGNHLCRGFELGMKSSDVEDMRRAGRGRTLRGALSPAFERRTVSRR